MGAAVVVIAPWSGFRGLRGVVHSTSPMAMVLLAGEAKPLFFGPTALAPASNPQHLAGAE